MKKMIAIILTIITLLTLPACQNRREPTPTLWIVTNVGFPDEQFGGEDDLRNIIEYLGGLPSGVDIELEVLPLEGAELHTRLTRLRTELLSGGGPDVFLMYAPTLPERELLFQIPQIAMDKYFMPLDELQDSAKFMEWDAMDQKVTAAGRTDKGQMLLPMFYGYNVAGTNEPVAEVPGSWDEALKSGDRAVQEGYGSGLRRSGFRDVALTDVVDYEGETMLITQEELNQRVKEALSFPYDDENARSWSMTELASENECIEQGWAGPAGTVFPLYNTDGGVTAKVNSYIAVNRSTTHKEDALTLVDMMMSRDFLTLEGFWSESRTMNQSGMFLFNSLRAWNGGNPIYDDFFEDGRSIMYAFTLTEDRQALHREIIDKISYAYIPTAADQELIKLFKDCKSAGSEEEIDKLVSKCYTTIEMILAES